MVRPDCHEHARAVASGNERIANWRIHQASLNKCQLTLRARCLRGAFLFHTIVSHLLSSIFHRLQSFPSVSAFITVFRSESHRSNNQRYGIENLRASRDVLGLELL